MRILQRAPREHHAEVGLGVAVLQQLGALRWLELVCAGDKPFEAGHRLRLVQRQPVLALLDLAGFRHVHRGFDADVLQVAQPHHEVAVLGRVLGVQGLQLVDFGQSAVCQQQLARHALHQRPHAPHLILRHPVGLELEREGGHHLVAQHLHGGRVAAGEHNADICRGRSNGGGGRGGSSGGSSGRGDDNGGGDGASGRYREAAQTPGTIHPAWSPEGDGTHLARRRVRGGSDKPHLPRKAKPATPVKVDVIIVVVIV
mmetsp:Transcript_40836/g.65471  ORF Transcript_40836/g.65471 Transcript_40836/m.65471 type:complete len:257 (-) Transcript_40836:7-777(-)